MKTTHIIKLVKYSVILLSVLECRANYILYSIIIVKNSVIRFI